MPTIQVAKHFRLQLDPSDAQKNEAVPQGEFIDFAPGAHDVSDAVANHWFVKSHLQKPKKTKPEPDSGVIAEVKDADEDEDKPVLGLNGRPIPNPKK